MNKAISLTELLICGSPVSSLFIGKHCFYIIIKSLRSELAFVIPPPSPTTTKSVEQCVVKFEKLFAEIPKGKYQRIHIVGHSMGGLIIRVFLSRNNIWNLGRCVLIATPNQGSDLALLVHSILWPLHIITPPI